MADAPSRYDLLMSLLESEEHKQALRDELAHFQSGPAVTQTRNDSTLPDIYIGVVKHMGRPSVVLTKAKPHLMLSTCFPWHLSSHGEEYWTKVCNELQRKQLGW